MYINQVIQKLLAAFDFDVENDSMDWIYTYIICVVKFEIWKKLVNFLLLSFIRNVNLKISKFNPNYRILTKKSKYLKIGEARGNK